MPRKTSKQLAHSLLPPSGTSSLSALIFWLMRGEYAGAVLSNIELALLMLSADLGAEATSPHVLRR